LVFADVEIARTRVRIFSITGLRSRPDVI